MSGEEPDTTTQAGGPRDPSSSNARNQKLKSPCTCKPGPGKPRNLVVCLDGTSNQFGKNNTNVVELYNHLVKSEEQLTYYNSGIGSIANVSNNRLAKTYRYIYSCYDLAFAGNFDKNIWQAYRWLSSCYREGDRIFLIGFSRGAWQVRTLAAMLERVGLLYRGNEDQIPFAYAHYKNLEDDDVDDVDWVEKSAHQKDQDDDNVSKLNQKAANKFKEAFSRDVQVHFVGVWDTVSSVGVIRSSRKFSDTNTAKHICYFRHALALDERRVKFLPEYVRGGEGPREPSQEFFIPKIKEVWFPGNHSAVGGGGKANENLNAGSLPLRWMVYQAALLGLDVKMKEDWMSGKPIMDFLADNQIEHLEPSPLKFPWSVINYIPVKRLAYKSVDGVTRWPPVMRNGRVIKPNQTIHYSIAFLNPDKYKPHATLPSEMKLKWSELVGVARGPKTGLRVFRNSKYEDLLEVDIFDMDIVKKLQEGIKEKDIDFTLRCLKLMSETNKGCRLLVGASKEKLTILTKLLHDTNSIERVRIGVADALETMVKQGVVPAFTVCDDETLFPIFSSRQTSLRLRNAVGKLLGSAGGIPISHDYSDVITDLFNLSKGLEDKLDTLKTLHRLAQRYCRASQSGQPPSGMVFNEELAKIFLRFLVDESKLDLVSEVTSVLKDLTLIEHARNLIFNDISSCLIDKLAERHRAVEHTPALHYASGVEGKGLSLASEKPDAQNLKKAMNRRYSISMSAANILSELITDKTSRDMIISTLQKKIPETSIPSIPAMILLVNLAKYDGGGDRWLNAQKTQSISFLRQVLAHGEDDAKCVCLTLLSALDGAHSTPPTQHVDRRDFVANAHTDWTITDYRDKMFDHDTISIICRLLRTGNGDIKKAVLEFIAGLTSDDFRQRVVDSEIASECRKLLRRRTGGYKYSVLSLSSFRHASKTRDLTKMSPTYEITTQLRDMLLGNRRGGWFAALCLPEQWKSGSPGGVYLPKTPSELKYRLRGGGFGETKRIDQKIAALDDDNREDTEFFRAVIDKFQGLLSNGNKDVRYTAIKDLYHYIRKGIFRNRRFSSEVITVLQGMLRDDVGDAREVAGEFLAELWKSDLHVEAFTPRILTVLNSILQKGNDEAKIFALSLLLKLASPDDRRLKNPQPLIDGLEYLLRSSRENDKHIAIRAIYGHSDNGVFQSSTFTSKLTNVLRDMLRDVTGDPGSWLSELWKNEIQRAVPTKFSPLGELFKQGNDEEKIFSALGDLIERGDYKAKMFAVKLTSDQLLGHHANSKKFPNSTDAFQDLLPSGQQDRYPTVRAFDTRAGANRGSWVPSMKIPERALSSQVAAVSQEIRGEKRDDMELSGGVHPELWNGELHEREFTVETHSLLNGLLLANEEAKMCMLNLTKIYDPASDDADNPTEFSRSVIEAFQELLCSDSKNNRHTALRAFYYHTKDEGFRHCVYNPQITTVLQEMLCDEGDDRELAGKLLSELWNGELHGQVFTKKTLSVLQALVEKGNEEAKMFALKLMFEFATNKADNRAEVSEFIDAFQTMLRAGSKTATSVIEAFYDHRHNSKFRNRVFCPEMTTTLQVMLRDDEGDAREMAIGVLAELWRSELHSEVFTPETLSVLERLLKRDNEKAKLFALKLIFELASDDGDNRTEISKRMINAFKNMLHSGSKNDKYTAIKAFYNHTEDGAFRNRVFSSQMTTVLQEMLRDEDEVEAREVACRLLSDMWKSEIHRDVFTPETLFVVKDILREGNDEAKMVILQFIFGLTSDVGDYGGEFSRVTIAAFQKMLRTGRKSDKYVAIRAFYQHTYSGEFRNRVFSSEVTTVLQEMLREEGDDRELAGRLLCELWRSELHSRVFTEETLSVLKTLLRKSNEEKKTFALRLIFELASDSGDYRAGFSQHMINAFQDMLRRGRRNDKYTAVKAFYQYTYNCEFRDHVFCSEVTAVLQEMLCDEGDDRELAGRLLSELWKCELYKEAFTPKTLLVLQNLLRKGNDEAKTFTLKLIFELTSEYFICVGPSAHSTVDGDRAEISKSMINAFREMLGRKSDKHTAIRAFYHHTDKGDLRNRVFSPQITAVLQGMLRGPSGDARRLAGKLLSELWNSELHGAVFTTETLSVLKILVGKGNDQKTQMFAWKLMFELASNEADKSAEFSRSIIEAFQDLLRSGNKNDRYTALRAFYYHTEDGGFRHRVFNSHLTIVMQEKLCDEGNARELAGKLLSELWNGELHGQVFTKKTLSVLQDLVRKGNEEAKMFALKLIFQLASDETDSNGGFSRSMIEAFRNLLRNGSKNDKYIALRAFYYHTEDDEFRNSIFCSEMTIALRAMLRDDEGDAREVAAGLLTQLWKSKLHSQVFTAETLSVLKSLVSRGNEKAKLFSLRLIFEFASDDDDNRAEAAEHMIDAFQNMLRTGSKNVRYVAIRAFYEYTENGVSRNKIFSSEITTVLHDMLREPNGDARRLAGKLLSELWESDLREHLSTFVMKEP